MNADIATADYRAGAARAAGLAIWTAAWAASLALAKFGPELLWGGQQGFSWAAVALNLLLGVGWIIAFTRFLRGLDELQRKILLDALAVTLGVGWVLGFGYVVAESAGLVTQAINLAVFPVLLGAVYLLATLVGTLRYR